MSPLEGREAPTVRQGVEPGELAERLRLLDGELDALHRLVGTGADCRSILAQISSAAVALQAIALEVLHAHVRDCVGEPARLSDVEGFLWATERVRRATREAGAARRAVAVPAAAPPPPPPAGSRSSARAHREHVP